MIAPKEDSDFVAHTEDVLDLYKRPYDPKVPVVCMDEKPTQLLKETRRRTSFGLSTALSIRHSVAALGHDEGRRSAVERQRRKA